MRILSGVKDWRAEWKVGGGAERWGAALCIQDGFSAFGQSVKLLRFRQNCPRCVESRPRNKSFSNVRLFDPPAGSETGSMDLRLNLRSAPHCTQSVQEKSL